MNGELVPKLRYVSLIVIFIRAFLFAIHFDAPSQFATHRNAILHEIDRHRAAFAQLLRDRVKEVEDAEFEVVKPEIIEIIEMCAEEQAA